MNFDRLRTFRALAETLHFRKAAERIHVSQSAVSQQISTLESELGVLLVERIGRRTFLTPAGVHAGGLQVARTPETNGFIVMAGRSDLLALVEIGEDLL